jgi:hypothetical protein
MGLLPAGKPYCDVPLIVHIVCYNGISTFIRNTEQTNESA